MCGIAGVIGSFSREEGLQVVGRMNSVTAHRGPDDEGAWATAGFAFGMRRLSIIDLECGRQPIWTPHGIGIVFNGEIYNYRQLRAGLEAEGYSFFTHSDTEVIPNLYHSGGIEALSRLEGMYGLCIYDPIKSRVYLVRDRLGIKPLYYGSSAGSFFFGSEIKGILAGMHVKPRLNKQAIHHYLTLRYVPSPMTMWDNIFKLDPGHFLSYDLNDSKFTIGKYWELDFKSEPLDPDRDYPAEFEKHFLDAVHSHLVASDVPVGVMLSGGLDSSAVSAAAVEMGHRNFHTFSIGFKDGGEYSELNYAKQTSERIGSRHFEVQIGKEEFIDYIPQFVHYTDEPLADLASIPLHFVSRLARQHVKTVLTGEGADEILAGYNMDVAAARFHSLGKISKYFPLSLIGAAGALTGIISPERAEKLKHLSKNGLPGYLKASCSHMTNYWTEEEKDRLMRGSTGFDRTDDLIRSWYDTCSSDKPIDQLQHVYCKSWLVEDLLMKADKMSMAASLELRVPFLTHPLVEWAFKLPLEWKVGDARNGFSSKKILRNFSEKRIPRAIIDRPKQGFPVPAYLWLSQGLGEWARKILFKGDTFTGSMLDMNAASAVFESAMAGGNTAAHKIWILLILEFWGKKWS